MLGDVNHIRHQTEVRMHNLNTVCVYCGSSTGREERYLQIARAVGKEIAGAGLTLVYGGASVGTMGVLADAALESDGEVIGVIPEALVEKEVAHEGLTELVKVRTMHERKSLMARRAEGFIAMPGGLGTLEELFEMWTWSQIGIHRKPIVLLNAEGYYDHLISFLDHAVYEGFVRPKHRSYVQVCERPEDALPVLSGQQAVS